MKEDQNDKASILSFVVNETLESFNELKKLRQANLMGRIDYDYEIARDRKSAIMLKGILAETHIENMATERMKITKK